MDINKLTASIQVHEGLELKVYDDANGKPIVSGYTVIGNPSCGYGRNLAGKGISNAEATALLGDDIGDVIVQAEAQTWWSAIQNDDVRCRAVLEILFNVGLGSFNGFIKAVSALCDGDFTTAADEFESSKWASQVGQRAVTLTAMIKTGEDPIAT